MKHIKQIGSGVYTFVIDSDGNAVTEDLEKHPSIVEHPDLFCIVNGVPPKGSQGLQYSNQTSSTDE